jgi:hypothetical protein
VSALTRAAFLGLLLAPALANAGPRREQALAQQLVRTREERDYWRQQAHLWRRDWRACAEAANRAGLGEGPP